MKKSSQNKSDITLLILSVVFVILNMLVYTKLSNITKWLNITLILSNLVLIIVMFILFSIENREWFRTIFITLVIITIITWIYQIVVFLGYEQIFSSVESMQNFIKSTGAWGIVVFMLIQFAQATFIPIPAMITTIAGSMIFGPTVAMISSLVAILLASIVSFFIGRLLGEKVVGWMIGKEACEKYSKLLYEKGKYVFFLMQVFPFFPDDILCLVAGMTKMSFKFFFITMLIARPLAIIPTCYLGGGTIIPYSGWGLIVWGTLIVLMIALFVLSYKYQNKIEQFVINFSSKFSKKKETKTINKADGISQDNSKKELQPKQDNTNSENDVKNR
ncbi:MAG: TVP38/TMEM64 family protein [Clostridia bacterium]|nr:TVP38/TMEM64 family protein [Clostridia bacterium]